MGTRPEKRAMLRALGITRAPWPRDDGPFPSCGTCGSRHHAAGLCPELDSLSQENEGWRMLEPWPDPDYVGGIALYYFGRLVRAAGRYAW